MDENQIVEDLFDYSTYIRYVAIYRNEGLVFRQRREITSGSSGQTDKFEELFVNPVILKAATQRGNLDCGGISHILFAYGLFNHMIFNIKNGHMSICLDKQMDLNEEPQKIIAIIRESYPEIF